MKHEDECGDIYHMENDLDTAVPCIVTAHRDGDPDVLDIGIAIGDMKLSEKASWEQDQLVRKLEHCKEELADIADLIGEEPEIRLMLLGGSADFWRMFGNMALNVAEIIEEAQDEEEDDA